MKSFALRFLVAVLTFVIGTAVSSLLWGPRADRTPKRPAHRHCSSYLTQVPATIPMPPPTMSMPPPVPAGWYKVDAKGLFAFYLPDSMRLSSREQSLEATWGSAFSNRRMQVYAEYSTWPEGYAPEYLAQQFEYEKERTEIDGRSAVVQSWRWADPHHPYDYHAEVRIYDAQGEKLVDMSAGCKDRQDVETARKIFKTIQFPAVRP